MARKKELERERKAKYKLRKTIDSGFEGGNLGYSTLQSTSSAGKPPHRRGLLKSEDEQQASRQKMTNRRTLISGIQALISKQVRSKERGRNNTRR